MTAQRNKLAPSGAGQASAEVRERLQQSDLRFQALAAANEVLSSTLDYDACLAAIGRLTVPVLGQWCFLEICGPAEAFARRVVFHVDATGRSADAGSSDRAVAAKWQKLFDVFRAGLPADIERLTAADLMACGQALRAQPAVRAAGFAAAMVLPIVFLGGRQGTLALAVDSRGDYTLHNVELGRALAVRASSALEKAMLFQSVAAENADRCRAEARFQRLLEAAPDAMVIAGPGGEIQLVNSRTEALFGYERRELLGKRIEVLLPHALRSEYARRRAEYLADAAARPRNCSLEIHARRKDGSEFPAEIMLSPLDTQEGMLLNAAIRDVSRRVAAEQQLRLITMAIDQVQDAVIITTPQAKPPGPRFVYVNPAFTHQTGYQGAEVLGCPLTLLHGPRTNLAEMARVRRTLGRGGACSGEILNYRKDGTHYWVSWRVSPVRDAQGAITHWVAVQHDITADKARQEQLRRSDRLASLGTLVAGIAHELNNPIAAALLTAEAARAMLPVASDGRLAVGTVVEALERCRQIVKDMLWFSSGQPTVRTRHDVNAIVRQAARLVSTYAMERGATLVLNLHDGLPEVLVSRLEIELALANLLYNAIQSRSEGARVEVTTVPAEQGVRVMVSDNGRGFTAEELKHAFDPFYTTRQQEGGTGLGLSIVFGIVREHRGTVRIGNGPGNGAIVVVEIPSAAAAANGSGRSRRKLRRYSS